MKKRKRRCDPEKQTYWEEVLQRWKDSGRSVRHYCCSEGLRESAFYFWRRELARRSQPSNVVNPPQKACRVSPAARPPKSSPLLRHVAPAFLPVQVVVPDVAEAARGVEIGLEHGGAPARRVAVRVSPGFDRQTLADVLAVLEVRPC